MATEIILKNVLDFTVISGKGKYDAFKNSTVAFVFKSFPGLISVNGSLLSNITSSENHIRFNTNPHKLRLETLGLEWNIAFGPPSHMMAKYIHNSETYIVVFGTINSNGVPVSAPLTCSTDIILSVEDTQVPQFIYGCRLEGKPTRNDCNSVVTMYNKGGSLSPGQIPV